MRLFYRILLHWAQFDLAVARSTGRSPRSIADLSADVARWELELFNLDWRLK
jgi:hypothetical protein